MFEARLREVRAGQWGGPTPCAEWTVRQLVNHVTRGNLNYTALVQGGSAAEFLRLRDADALGSDPLAAYLRSVDRAVDAFTQSDALCRIVDYPLGKVSGRQALAIRTTDTAIHTWDLARAIGSDDTLEPALIDWIGRNLQDIYGDLPETPLSSESTHRFFAAPTGTSGSAVSQQDHLLRRMGRSPEKVPF
ncbi:TIGR03086 family metal-binding protein [Nocardia sp. CDC160]|nr:TIGR03086 family metal-binding protein [Nocardia sp. CDC160]MEC3918422.1 TIGR03086 family metal-binding protein [Nocardia sp. CDC160]